MGGDSAPTFVEVEAALAAVQRTLDRLTALGHDAQAFDLARAQYAASIRSSWPGNLSTLTGSLEKIARDSALGLSDSERHDLDRAIAVLSRVQHP
jgi:hypothetical protein